MENPTRYDRTLEIEQCEKREEKEKRRARVEEFEGTRLNICRECLYKFSELTA